ncbi:MAG: efflux RND transporter periplasmic adaptor subunit [Acidobacteriota bacterium]
MKKLLIRLLIVGLLGIAAWGGYTVVKTIPQQKVASLPTAKVRQGDVIVRTYARGELRAVRSATLTAPNLFGTIQVTRLAALGALSKEKDLIAEFDDSELQSRLEEKQLEIDQVDEQLKKSQADLAIRNNQDQVELLRTRYSVRRAELEVKRNEIISQIDAKKNLLNLEEAKRRLTQLESDIKSRREQAQAELAVLKERKNKALLELNRERMRLNQVKLLAPMSGLVAIRQTRPTFFMPGMQLPDIREGDQLQAGMPVADILDLSELEVIARVGELDRANLHEGQDVVMTMDALAEKKLSGKIKSMSGTASANIFSSDPAKKFDVLFSIDMPQLLSALGANKDQIARIMAQAEANRKRAPAGNGPSLLSALGGGMMMGGAPGGAGGPGGGGNMVMGGGAPGGGGPGGAPGGPPQAMIQIRPGGGAGGPGGAGGAGGAGGGAASTMTSEQRIKMREIMQKALDGKSMQDLTPEERTTVMAKVQEELKKAGITAPAGMGRGGNRGGEQKGGEQSAQAGGAPGGPGGAGGGRRGGGPGGPGGMPMMGGGGGQRYNQADMDNAKLPPPPEEDNQLDVLLRPGLLADVEIIVEKIPNAINVPAQAIFQKDNKMVVYVKENGKFVPREIVIKKRSENVFVIESGVKPGEEIAMADPEAKPGDKKKDGKGGGGAMGNLPGGKKG